MIRSATLPLGWCCISTFSAAKCPQPCSNCEAGKMELLTILFMIDPDPSRGSRGLAVTLHSRCFHATGRFGGLLCFHLHKHYLSFSQSRPLARPSFLSASASCEGKAQVEAFHRPTLARDSLDLQSLPSGVTQHAAMPALCFPRSVGQEL